MFISFFGRNNTKMISFKFSEWKKMNLYSQRSYIAVKSIQREFNGLEDMDEIVPRGNQHGNMK